MKKIVCLLGSPRDGGNSDQLANRFCAAAEKHGAKVNIHALRDLRFDGYIPDAERHREEALGEHPDDLEGVLADVAKADILVVATPIYFCNMTGLLKQALDRFFEFLKPDYLTAAIPSRLGRDRRFVLVQVQGEGEDRYGDLLEQYGPALDKLGYTHLSLLRACSVREIGDVQNQRDVLQKADHLARSLVLGENVTAVG
ncbi:MAG: NAD(P)H-dependent oxidoreductase [Pseudomonadota bacterium]